MNIHNIAAWPYFSPIFGENEIRAQGNLGLAKAGVNLAVWSAAVGGIAHLAGSKHAVKIGIGVFVALVLVEVAFGASNGNQNGTGYSIFNPPATAAPPTQVNTGPYNGLVEGNGPATGSGGFYDGEEAFGSAGNGF